MKKKTWDLYAPIYTWAMRSDKKAYDMMYDRIPKVIQDKFVLEIATVIHCFYAAKMGGQDEAHYRQHFSAPDIIRHDLQHEELLVCYPQKWASEVENCCGIANSASGKSI